MLGLGVSGARPPTARVDFAEVYSKCALAFTSGEIKRAQKGRRQPEARDGSGLPGCPRRARSALECGVKLNDDGEKANGDD